MPSPASVQEQDVQARALAFRAWADGIPHAARSAEWECDYDGWPAIWEAVRVFLDLADPVSMDAPAMDDLLFLLARDNETETIARLLAARPALLFRLAGDAPDRAEPDARWQLADAIGRVAGHDEAAVHLLSGYCQDPDEYTRRRALFALSRRGAPEAVAHAETAWATGHPYACLAALQALADLRAPAFWIRHAEALSSGNPLLAEAAERLAAAWPGRRSRQ